MASTIITKNSSTASAAPTAGQLVQGELAVNVTDKKLYTKDAGGNIVVIAQPASAAEVTLTNAVALTNKDLSSGTNTFPASLATLTGTQILTNKIITGFKETKVAIAASAIDLSLANYFTKTISGTTTFTVSNVPATGTTASFILELTNGGSATVNWFSGVKWAGGTAPTLTAAGVDILGFYTHDGGTTWRGLVLAKDSK